MKKIILVAVVAGMTALVSCGDGGAEAKAYTADSLAKVQATADSLAKVQATNDSLAKVQVEADTAAAVKAREDAAAAAKAPKGKNPK